MKTLMKTLLRICQFGVVLALLFLSVREVAFAKEGGVMVPRTVQLSPSHPDNPVKIVKVMLDGVEVKPGVLAWPTDKPGVPFQANNEWFNHLTIVLKNISAKKIVCGTIHASFSETGDGTQVHPTIDEQSSIGNLPEHGMYSGLTGTRFDDVSQRDPILVEPGQEFTIPVINHDHSDGIKEMIESRQPLSSITTIRVGIAAFYFEDGTRWAGDNYYRPDYSVPGKYIRISRKEFDAYKVIPQ